MRASVEYPVGILLNGGRGTATLRSIVEVRDSGRFSYHLQELTGHLLTRSADGYSLHEDCCDRFVDVVSSIDI